MSTTLLAFVLITVIPLGGPDHDGAPKEPATSVKAGAPGTGLVLWAL